MGGIISRECLTYLDLSNYTKGFFMTLATPHLGISGNQNSILNLGLNVLTYFKNKKSVLNELMLNDEKDIR